MESYYLPHPASDYTASPYLHEDQVPQSSPRITTDELPPTGDLPMEPVPILPAVFDEETHALLHGEPILDLLMQTRPLVWSFNGSRFDTPDRFLPKDISVENWSPLGEFLKGIGAGSNFPVNETTTELAAPSYKLQARNPMAVSYEIEAPWWIPHTDMNRNDMVTKKCTVPMKQSTELALPLTPPILADIIPLTDDVNACSVGVQASPSVEEVEVQAHPAHVQTGTDADVSIQCLGTGTQCDTVPRIVIDAVTGTDEMEHDLAFRSTVAPIADVDGHVQNVMDTDMLDRLTLDCNHATLVPLPRATIEGIVVDAEKQEPKSSESEEYEFVEAQEAAE